MLYRYEVLMLTGPYLTSLESQTIEQAVTKTITSNDASVLSYDRWGKYELAYPINKLAYGIYFLVRFETTKSPEALLKAVNELFKIKLDTLVSRYVISKLDPLASLEYAKPESLETVPSKSGTARHASHSNSLFNETKNDLDIETASLLEEEL